MILLEQHEELAHLLGLSYEVCKDACKWQVRNQVVQNLNVVRSIEEMLTV
jgi:hypothetical protein